MRREEENGVLRPVPLAPLPERPLVSVLMPNYNYARYLSDAIESALRQTYSNLELIICDDGSTDSSREILERYESLDSRIKAIYQANAGQSQALNAAFCKSSGEIICLLDADDVFLPEKVQRVVQAFAADPCSGLAVNRMLLVDKSRGYLGSIPTLYPLPSGWHGALLSRDRPHLVRGLPPTSGLSLRRSVAEVIFPLPTGLRAYSDTLIQVLAPLATRIAPIEIPLSEYRVHGDNIAGVSAFTESRLKNIVSYEAEIWLAWRRYLASPCSGLTPDFPLPSKMPPSVMDYAYARFRRDRNSRAIHEAIPRTYLQTLPRPHRLFWRMSIVLPNWLFRESFNFAYGQTWLKMMTRRVANSGIRSWFRRPLRGRAPNNERRVSAKSTSSPRDYFLILGVGIRAAQLPGMIAQMESWIRGRDGCHSVAATGMHGVVEAQHDPAFKKILNATDWVVPDGMPLVWLGRRRGFHLPRRVYGPELMLAFCERTAGKGYRHFFYGGKPGVPERLAESLKSRFPEIQIAGTYSPSFRPLGPKEGKEIEDTISRAAPDVVWVGLGTPKQERWMHEHRAKLRVPVLVGVGAAFDILSGTKTQAPVWMREHGLEWLFRLLQEPRRLWRRYIIYGAEFLGCVALERLRTNRLRPPRAANSAPSGPLAAPKEAGK